MKFLLTHVGKYRIRVNMSNVTYYCVSTLKLGTKIAFIDGTEITVNETPEEIDQAIGA